MKPWLPAYEKKARAKIMENCDALNKWAIRTREHQYREDVEEQEIREETEKEYWG